MTWYSDLFCYSYSTLLDCNYPYSYSHPYSVLLDWAYPYLLSILVFCFAILFLRPDSRFLFLYYIHPINTWHSSQVCLAFLFLQTWHSPYKYVTFVIILLFCFFAIGRILHSSQKHITFITILDYVFVLVFCYIRHKKIMTFILFCVSWLADHDESHIKIMTFDTV